MNIIFRRVQIVYAHNIFLKIPNHNSFFLKITQNVFDYVGMKFYKINYHN